MFEELFEGPIARARQRESPLPDERRRLLSHLQTLGYAHSSLRAIACELIVIAARLDLSGSEPFDAASVTAAARRWATYRVLRHHSTDPTLSRSEIPVEAGGHGVACRRMGYTVSSSVNFGVAVRSGHRM
jgi:hypothetical protein